MLSIGCSLCIRFLRGVMLELKMGKYLLSIECPTTLGKRLAIVFYDGRNDPIVSGRFWLMLGPLSAFVARYHNGGRARNGEET